MSEPKSKHKKRKSNTKNKESVSKKKNVIKKSISHDGIAKSKQLAQKLETSKYSSYGRPKIHSSNNELRLCGNGKPMPSLFELEKMFEDSDNDEDNKVSTPTTAPTTPEHIPKPKIEEKLMSPTTILEISNAMLNLVSNISDPTELLEDGPRPPIIKPKKRRKPDEPYIVGCKDRPQVPQKPSVKFCKGDDKFGPDSSAEEDDDLPKKRTKRHKKVNISKSIFNAKSDEIAVRLKEFDGDSNGSSDSNKTVAYEYYMPMNSTVQRPFSPLPSTSKDNDTFIKNDQRFNESFNTEYIAKTNFKDEIQNLEAPGEIIEINDTLPSTKSLTEVESVIEIMDDGPSPIFDDKLLAGNKTGNDILEVEEVKQASPIIIDDYYSNIDLENVIPDDEICEVIDVDDIIAKTDAIIKKYSNNNHLDTVTVVDSSIINNSESKHSDTSPIDLEKVENVTETAINNLDNTNSERNSTTNEHLDILVENIQRDVEIIDDSNYHPTHSYDNGSKDDSVVELVSIDLQNSRSVNKQGNNQSITTNHRCICDNGVNPIPPNNHSISNPPTPRIWGNRCNNGCEIQESASNNDSYQQQLKILAEFFKTRQSKGKGNSLKRQTKKKNPRMDKNILTQHFASLLQSMTNNIPNETTGNNCIQPSNNTSSPTLSSTDSPDKNRKRIGDCPICMDTLSNKPIVSTICGHVFCMDCIKLSIKSNGNRCPTCRKALKKGTGYHQIFL